MESRRWLVTVMLLGGCYGDPVRNFLPGHDAAPITVDAWLVDVVPRDVDVETPCSTLTATMDVTLVNESGSAPTPMGGTVPDGIYVLESSHVYGGTGFIYPKLTIRIASGGTLYDFARRAADDPQDVLQSGPLVMNSATTKMSLTATCPLSGTTDHLYSYNAGDGSFDWFDLVGAVVQLEHFVPM